MALNIHPIVVHFPIALLTIYGILELIRFRRIIDQSFWFYLKAVLSILGAASAAAAILTGKLIESEFRASMGQVLHIHQRFAYATILVFGILAALHLVLWLDEAPLQALKKNTIWTKFVKLCIWALGWPSIILALLGIAYITITGALGGIMVYGPNIDPVASFVYHLVFP